MTEELSTVTPRVLTKRETELLKYAREIVLLIESGKARSVADVYIVVNKIIKVLGPSYANIPSDMKKALGVAYATSLAENEIGAKAAYTRSALSILRGAVQMARGPKSQLNRIDDYIYSMENEMKSIEEGGEEAMLDKLWAKTNRANDYLTLMVFSGYGELNSKGFNFSKKEDTRESLK